MVKPFWSNWCAILGPLLVYNCCYSEGIVMPQKAGITKYNETSCLVLQQKLRTPIRFSAGPWDAWGVNPFTGLLLASVIPERSLHARKEGAPVFKMTLSRYRTKTVVVKVSIFESCYWIKMDKHLANLVLTKHTGRSLPAFLWAPVRNY